MTHTAPMFTHGEDLPLFTGQPVSYSEARFTPTTYYRQLRLEEPMDRKSLEFEILHCEEQMFRAEKAKEAGDMKLLWALGFVKFVDDKQVFNTEEWDKTVTYLDELKSQLAAQENA
jgi:hypothetical protein